MSRLLSMVIVTVLMAPASPRADVPAQPGANEAKAAPTDARSMWITAPAVTVRRAAATARPPAACGPSPPT